MGVFVKARMRVRKSEQPSGLVVRVLSRTGAPMLAVLSSMRALKYKILPRIGNFGLIKKG